MIIIWWILFQLYLNMGSGKYQIKWISDNYMSVLHVIYYTDIILSLPHLPVIAVRLGCMWSPASTSQWEPPSKPLNRLRRALILHNSHRITWDDGHMTHVTLDRSQLCWKATTRKLHTQLSSSKDPQRWSFWCYLPSFFVVSPRVYKTVAGKWYKSQPVLITNLSISVMSVYPVGKQTWQTKSRVTSANHMNCPADQPDKCSVCLKFRFFLDWIYSFMDYSLHRAWWALSMNLTRIWNHFYLRFSVV